MDKTLEWKVIKIEEHYIKSDFHELLVCEYPSMINKIFVKVRNKK
jgi:hypothetical protein